MEHTKWAKLQKPRRPPPPKIVVERDPGDTTASEEVAYGGYTTDQSLSSVQPLFGPNSTHGGKLVISANLSELHQNPF